MLHHRRIRERRGSEHCRQSPPPFSSDKTTSRLTGGDGDGDPPDWAGNSFGEWVRLSGLTLLRRGGEYIPLRGEEVEVGLLRLPRGRVGELERDRRPSRVMVTASREMRCNREPS